MSTNSKLIVRGSRVMLDEDLARLYGVTTSALNQAVKGNVEITDCDVKDQARWKAILAMGVHRTGCSDAFERTKFEYSS